MSLHCTFLCWVSVLMGLLLWKWECSLYYKLCQRPIDVVISLPIELDESHKLLSGVWEPSQKWLLMFSSEEVNRFHKWALLYISPGLSQPRPPEQQSLSLSCSSCLGPPAAAASAAARCGEAGNNGSETGPVGPDGRRGGARLESGPAGHEATEEGGGEAEVSWDLPCQRWVFFSLSLLCFHTFDTRGDLRGDDDISPVSRNDQI